MSGRPPTPTPKWEAVAARLRRLFTRIDKLERELGKARRAAAVQIRLLSSIDGQITPMRPEQARREVFRDVE